MKPDAAKIIEDGARILGVSLEPHMVSGMLRHMSLLLEWQRRVNLTSLTDTLEVAIFHFLDSLTLFKIIGREYGLRILDVGSGAGFPGIVLKVVETRFALTLLDKSAKRTVFLKNLVRELGLREVSFLNTQLAVVLKNPPARPFDLIVSRAFSSHPEVLDSFHVLLKPEGRLLRMAGPASMSEEFRLSRFTPAAEWSGTLPFSSHFRRVIAYSRTN
jgi:16S rRNA (guanine527-N7)-methyltransferase